MAITFKIGEFDDAKDVRTRVFMEEQGFENEFEDLDQDPVCVHVTAYDGDGCVGCARVFPADAEGQVFNLPVEEPEEGDDVDGARDQWIFGRLAVLPETRKGGLGSKVLAESERVAKERGATEMHLHAQCVAAPFYEKNGYAAYGPIELDEGVKHRWMRKRL